MLSLNENVPGMMIWVKTWKISQSLPQPGQMSPALDWGHSWNFLNLQPDNEGKLWVQQDMNSKISNNYNLYQCNKADKAVHSQQPEQEKPDWTSDWKDSWKYTKQRKDSDSAGNWSNNSKLDKLLIPLAQYGKVIN